MAGEIGIVGQGAACYPPLLVKGHYRDAVTDLQGHVRWNSGWRSNLIVHDCSVLLAALLKRHRRMRGILYWAVGEGEKAWDALCPSPRLSDSRLAVEIRRQAPDEIVYLDDVGKPSRTPTSCLEVTAAFSGRDLVQRGTQSLREFGLFGGKATEKADSGYMIDYVIHPRIDLSANDTLERRVRLMLASTGIVDDILFDFGADLPVASLDGIGRVYAEALSEQKINSLGDLVEIDPLIPIGNIPPFKLREFYTKARLVMGTQVSRVWLTPFAKLSVSQFLLEKPEDLAQPDVPPEIVRSAQGALANLQIALDEAQLREITLGDMLTARW